MLALNYYQQAIVVDTGGKDRRGRALRRERLGRTFLELKDYDLGCQVLKEALGIPPPPGYRRHYEASPR